jgi:hypothetical protein
MSTPSVRVHDFQNLRAPEKVAPGVQTAICKILNFLKAADDWLQPFERVFEFVAGALGF